MSYCFHDMTTISVLMQHTNSLTEKNLKELEIKLLNIAYTIAVSITLAFSWLVCLMVDWSSVRDTTSYSDHYESYRHHQASPIAPFH